LKGFAAAVAGGLGNTFGGIAGGLVLGLLEALGGGLIASEIKDVLAFAGAVRPCRQRAGRDDHATAVSGG